MSSIESLLEAHKPAPLPDPTDEQQAIIDVFTTGDSFVVEAGAGTGKTTTLGMVARTTKARGVYVAFNKSIVTESGSKMPGNVRCSTAHSLAYQAVGKPFRPRLNSPRMRSGNIARLLNIRACPITVAGHRKTLAPWRIAGVVLRTITEFCHTADLDITTSHVPTQKGLDAIGGRQHQQELAEHVVPYARTAWADLCSLDGQLPYKHEHYLKLWQLGQPHIPADFILFDEAQDANPVMAAIVAAQADHAQLGWIGDSQQQIYSFTGAINALAQLQAEHRLYLSQSWRFGDEIATAANQVLAQLGAQLRLTGRPGQPATVGPLPDDDVTAILCRTNARTMVEVIRQVDDLDRRPHLVGGGEEIIRFARAAADLMDGKPAFHPDLACFDDWHEVLEYVATDEQGGELALMVDLVKRFGARRIIAILNPLPPEQHADVVISTAHKAKGREWSNVRLADDLDLDPEEDEFNPGLDQEELRLLYVAATRARNHLDPAGVRLSWPEYDPPDIEAVA